MRFKLNSKLLSLTSNFQIRDESDRLAFVAEGKFLSWGHDLTIRSADGTEVARIQQKLMNWLPTFDLSIHGKPFAVISREFSWFKKKFKLDVPGPNDYEIDGDFWNYEYQFRRRGRTVAMVSRKMFSLTGVYGVDIIPDEDIVSILATVVVVALVNRSDESD